MSFSDFQIEPCPSGDLAAGLEVLYHRQPPGLRSGRIAEILSFSASGELDLSGLWVARTTSPWLESCLPHGIVGALFVQPLAGPATAIWAPEIIPAAANTGIAEALVRAVLAHLRASGVRMVQAILDEATQVSSGRDLDRGGLPLVTEIEYLDRATDRPPVQKDDPVPFAIDWHPVDRSAPGAFLRAISATFEASFDMPELQGVRNAEDMLTAARGGKEPSSGLWQMGIVRGQPDIALVLLLSEAAATNVWEITYLGLPPQARRLGLGRQIVARALELARPHARSLQLAVDVRNHPALRLYESTGFLPFDRRFVHLAVFPEDGRSSMGGTGIEPVTSTV